MLPGFANRVAQDVKKLIANKHHVQVIAPPQRNLAVWRGADILASAPYFDQILISKHEYEEYGYCSLVKSFL